ncbi:phosphate/phosphite/phosphonate ABC transporter substrate-binding protein [Litoreibacter roseus]|uniref:Phosphate ABC transporter substrate-binding protein n=1 Tax=Litoreibacter roseus TaxID=2601869 RepID=A0A6N6JKF8_9RHOB|nr:PhnD/SsuA/transferrin family substrate-binding protein [Litoreibacter roseus]GFE65919.1 phosphate ABC transporter substrate-binding protein [Litoreibacter roseus]
MLQNEGFASFPMYDRPETADAYDRIWRSIRDYLRQNNLIAPDHLTRSGDPWSDWTRSDLILSQTCGYPYRARLAGEVSLVGSPVLAIPDCPEGQYFSVFAVRREDGHLAPKKFAEKILAYNDPMSQSGWAAPQTYATTHGFSFGKHTCTGSHRASAKAVADSHADIAAIDVLTWRLIQRYDPFAAALTVIGQTDPSPALPYITSNTMDASVIRAALDHGFATLSAKDLDILGITGITTIPLDAYLAVPTPPAPA